MYINICMECNILKFGYKGQLHVLRAYEFLADTEE